LVFFTLAAAILVGLYASPLITRALKHADGVQPNVFLFASLGLAAIALSLRHLGKPFRSWRAMLNLRRSWLSREVFLFSVFLVAGCAVLASDVTGVVTYSLPAAIGFAALFSMDRVYRVTRAADLGMHSARVFLSGLLFTSLLSGNITLFSLFAVVKTFLYLYRKFNAYRRSRPYRPWWTRARVVVGLVAPLLIWWKGPGSWQAVVVGCVVAGELIDRCEFYVELDAPSPARQMAEDLSLLRDHAAASRTEGV
jgi:DMSO reductase anchor subunit